MGKKATNKYYVYLHRTLDTDEVFYVGKGSGKRSNSRSGRNPYWKATVNRHGFKVEVIKFDLFEDEAYQLEIETIAKLKGEGVKLTNLTLGGNDVNLHNRLDAFDTLSIPEQEAYYTNQIVIYAHLSKRKYGVHDPFTQSLYRLGASRGVEKHKQVLQAITDCESKLKEIFNGKSE